MEGDRLNRDKVNIILCDQMVPVQSDDYCSQIDGSADRNGVSFETLVDGEMDTLIACNIPAEVGQKAFGIIAPASVTELQITYARPLYARMENFTQRSRSPERGIESRGRRRPEPSHVHLRFVFVA